MKTFFFIDRKFFVIFSIFFLFGSFAIAKAQYNSDPSGVVFINLNHHEKAGGHTIERHCCKSDEYLKKRLDSGRYRVVSTFDNKSSAESAILELLQKEKEAVSKWWNSEKKKEAFFAEVSLKARFILKKDYKINPSVKSTKIDGLGIVRVVLSKDYKNNQKSWYVLTAFPDADKN